MNTARSFASSVVHPATRRRTSFVISGVVAARCGAQRPQYQREMVGQSFAVERRIACTHVESGGMSGSGNACGTSFTSHRRSVRPFPSGLSGARTTVFPKGWRMTTLRTGFALGWSTVYTVERIGAVYSKSCMSAHVPAMRALRVRFA